ncbi:ROK family transcriptional regulator [Actinoplanes subglobosus]|uniref:ROK family protein n=1 Tax=Actinoplanes subglobosus TaxID=1547892 RepID=A0ABV8ISG0_9ACTN
MTTRTTALLRMVHRNPGVTRADAARLLGVGTGAATELVTRLSRAALLTQAPAAPSGTRGRPTTLLLPHPDGPLVLALAITHEAWRLDVVALGGATLASLSERHGGAPWAEVRAAVTVAIKDFLSRYGDRLRAIGISVPGPVSRNLRLDAFNSDWHGIDLTDLWPEAGLLVAGNDATLAATAEHRRGAATGAAVALHLRIEAGLGGAVIDDGHPVIGAHGAAGEFGHMPFGDPAVRCGCGAHGCWGTAVDGTALARLLGDPPPRDPVTYARRVIATATRALPSQRARQDLAGLPPPTKDLAGLPPPTRDLAGLPPPTKDLAGLPPPTSAYSSGESGPAIDPAAAADAVRTVGTALGRGIAGLVNALDPDLVTLGGLGVDLLAAVPEAIDTAYRSGLMLIHRTAPPPVRAAALPDDEGPIAGAAEEAWSALLPQLT